MAEDIKKVNIVRASKDEGYRNNLTAEQLAALPPTPAGDGDLSEEELDDVSGGIIAVLLNPVRVAVSKNILPPSPCLPQH